MPKCEKPSSGPCQPCSRLGKQCQIGGSTSRPYYHTSKERYDLLVSVVRHFVPSASFSTDNLRQLVGTLPAAADASQPPAAMGASSGGPGPSPSETLVQLDTPPSSSTGPVSQECTIEDLEGTLMVDAMNILFCLAGFNGPSSCTTLNAKMVSHFAKDTGGLSPFEESEPPSLFDGQVTSYQNPDYLPDRKALDQAAVKFFAEINSVIYIIDQDRFHLWLDDVYGGKGVCASVLVILYLVMALCGHKDPSFDIARSYMDNVIEESSLESVRAIMLMSLYRQREDDRSVSWAILGVAIRISQSLGIHQRIGYAQDTSIYGSEVKRRLWWSLCEFDNWSSCMLGRPPSFCSTDHDILLPSQEFNSTPYTPPGYATSSASLGIMIGQISQQLYLQSGDLRSKEQLTGDLIQKVEGWKTKLPDHLRPNSAFPSCFARATLYLSLKYNYARMLIGRPYMTHLIFCRNTHDAVFKSRAEACKLANDDMIEILTEFYRQGLLSASFWFDTYFILATAIVLFLRAVETSSMQKELRSFLPILKLCDYSKVGRYAAECFERFLHNLENGMMEIHHMSAADSFPQSSRLANSSGLCNEINFNDLGDFNTIASECFGLGGGFDLDLCGVELS
ncbi:uncharacterized protein TRUGW13939_02050 [Talaromyces rugulosus]|uniref:Xylanolytic transcriptional activator regulatory domain-containing protein n=1 Tax=Talaromyces rugulosus TaxID=121627 RepID=A0A7H8QLZ9_TALRU|nr:uncharacterized protein TRUGW13939_02050 [Talaromyces rugulosus]QKX54960.1 hypothetical protein TRUGW13939_02050 [Talaromyces rugulosus]